MVYRDSVVNLAAALGTVRTHCCHLFAISSPAWYALLISRQDPVRSDFAAMRPILELDPTFDYTATFLWATSGALLAARLRYCGCGRHRYGLGPWRWADSGRRFSESTASVDTPTDLLAPRPLALLACIVYLVVFELLVPDPQIAGVIAIGVAFGVRLLALRFGWSTHALLSQKHETPPSDHAS